MFVFLKHFTQLDEVCGEHEPYVGFVGNEGEVGFGTADGFVRVGAGKEFVEYAEVCFVGGFFDAVEDGGTTACFGLEEAVSGSGVGDINVAVDVVEGGEFAGFVEAVAELLGEEEVDGGGFEEGGFAGGIGAGNEAVVFHFDVVFHDAAFVGFGVH